MNILDYINGDRKGRGANRIEREAMSDPLLRDALEGLDAVDGDHARAIEGLRRKIAARCPVRRVRRFAAAAAVILCLTAGGLYLLLDGRGEPGVPLADAADQSVQVMATVTPDADTAAAARPEAAKMSEVGTTDIITVASDFCETIPEVQEVGFIEIDETFAFVENVTHTGISGRVTDAGGNPLAGATVSLQGKGGSAVTDTEGNFVLETEDTEGTILVSMAGYEPVKVAADADRHLTVALNRSGAGPDEAAFTGAGTRSARAAAVQNNKRPAASKMADVITNPEADSLRAVNAFGLYLEKEGVIRIDKRLGGKVVLEFRADQTGTPKDVAVVSSPGRAARREAIRLLRSSRVTWPPGMLMRVEVDFDAAVKR